jgi:hypothetical protein
MGGWSIREGEAWWYFACLPFVLVSTCEAEMERKEQIGRGAVPSGRRSTSFDDEADSSPSPYEPQALVRQQGYLQLSTAEQRYATTPYPGRSIDSLRRRFFILSPQLDYDKV